MFIERKKDFIKAALLGLMLAIFGYWPAFLAFGGKYPVWPIFFILPVFSAVGIYFAIFAGKYVPVIFQIAKFGAVGVLNTLIDFSILNFLVYVFGIYGGWQVGIFNMASFSIAVANSYFWNKYWTFEHKEKAQTKEFAQFLTVSIVGILINSGIIYVLTTWIPPLFGMSPALWLNSAKIAATLASLVLNFVGYKYIVFK